MPNDRVIGLLVAYFTQPYVEYGEVALEIRNNGGLTSEEIRAIEDKVLSVDAKAMIRHTSVTDESRAPGTAKSLTERVRSRWLHSSLCDSWSVIAARLLILYQI